MTLYETVTIRRPLPYPLSDLAGFVLWLEKTGKINRDVKLDDEALVAAVRDYWDMQHGED